MQDSLILQRQEVESQHRSVDLDDITAFEKENLMEWRRGGLIYSATNMNFDYLVRIELDLNLRRFERTYYNVIDLLGDIGGVQSILTSFAAIVILILKHDRVSNFIAASLFKVSHDNSPTPN